jgi:hypothetical protein
VRGSQAAWRNDENCHFQISPDDFRQTKQFRESAYTLLGLRKDAIVDLMDAVLTSPQVNSFVETVTVTSVSTSLAKCVFWVRSSRPQRDQLMKLAWNGHQPSPRPLLAETTRQPRPSSDIRDRTIEHQATQIEVTSQLWWGTVSAPSLGYLAQGVGFTLRHERAPASRRHSREPHFNWQVCKQLASATDSHL